jgi:hypothetical protein
MDFQADDGFVVGGGKSGGSGHGREILAESTDERKAISRMTETRLYFVILKGAAMRDAREGPSTARLRRSAQDDGF